MPRRLLVVDLDPNALPDARRVPLLMLTLGPHQVALSLDAMTAEEVLAELLASGVAVRGSRVVEG